MVNTVIVITSSISEKPLCRFMTLYTRATRQQKHKKHSDLVAAFCASCACLDVRTIYCLTVAVP